MLKFQTLNKPDSLARLAYDAILDSILDCRLNSDEIYNEKGVAKDLGISRTPVREALLELSFQGFVKFLPRKGFIVRRFNTNDITEIFEIRTAIEVMAIEKVASLTPRPDLTKIQKILDVQRDALWRDDFYAFIEADRLFHLAFCELARNLRMLSILENLRKMNFLMGNQALANRKRWKPVIAEHIKILDAVKNGEPHLAREAMIDHLIKSEAAVRGIS
jgi:DNA-binding GntR family transcriptional regulator